MFYVVNRVMIAYFRQSTKPPGIEFMSNKKTGSPYRKATKNNVSLIIQLLSRIYPFSKGLQQAFYTHTHTIQLSKNEVLLRQGETCQYMYFIKKGAMMGYSVHNNKKITTYISIETAVTRLVPRSKKQPLIAG